MRSLKNCLKWRSGLNLYSETPSKFLGIKLSDKCPLPSYSHCPDTRTVQNQKFREETYGDLGDHGFRHRFDFSKNSTNSIKTIRLPSRQFLGKLFQLKWIYEKIMVLNLKNLLLDTQHHQSNWVVVGYISSLLNIELFEVLRVQVIWRLFLF